MKKTIFSLITLSAITFSLAACSSSDSNENSFVGTWGTPDTHGEPSLTLEEDGSAFGSDGCNRMMGTYTADGSEITFGPLATTMMYCDGVDTWLSTGHTANVDGDVMTVFNESGESIGTLNRN